MNKRAPYTPPTSWDIGPNTIATLGHVPRIVGEFRAYLRAYPALAQIISAADKPHGSKAEARRRRDAANATTRKWMAANGYAPAMEDATTIDPETGKSTNPNGVKRARRIDLIEHYRIRGIITQGEFTALMALRMAYEKTQRGPPAIQEIQVDTSPKPDHAVAILMDRISGYSQMMAHVRPEHRQVITCVVLDNRTVAQLGFRGRRYQSGMDIFKAAASAFEGAVNRR